MSKINSGAHLGVVRSWIKFRFWNGDRVTWGSGDVLETGRPLHVNELERLAQDICDAVLNEETRVSELDDLMSTLMRQNKISLTISYKNFIAQSKIETPYPEGKEIESPEYVSFRGALLWLKRIAKELLPSVSEGSNHKGEPRRLK